MVSSPLLDSLEGRPQTVSEILRAARLDELLGGDRRRRLTFGAGPVPERKRRGREGSLLIGVQSPRLHVVGRRVDGVEVFQHPEGAFDDFALDVALVRL